MKWVLLLLIVLALVLVFGLWRRTQAARERQGGPADTDSPRLHDDD